MNGELQVASPGEVPNVVWRLREGYRAFMAMEVFQQRRHRFDQVERLKKLLDENKQAIRDALWKDLHKAVGESDMMEYNLCYHDVMVALNSLDDWIKPRKMPVNLMNVFNSVAVTPEPYGVVAIFGAWNYPFQLVFLPLVGALAAGNSVLIKPSECAVATSNLFTDLIPQYFDPCVCSVVPGEVEVAEAVAKQRYDYIFYTGSTKVGKLIMKAAAEHVTPLTLELGGKTPVVVLDDANIKVAARRIIWGKISNSGQSCNAPDYVLCTPSIRDSLVEGMKVAITEFLSENSETTDDYGRIINTTHYRRLCGLLDATNGRVVLGGVTKAEERFIAPTVLVDVPHDDVLLQEEIFGPILPIVTIDNVAAAIQFVREREKPLALYVFTTCKENFERICRQTSSGSISHNDTLMYFVVPSIPFGGVGYSGFGAYHGKHTFDTFSHTKPKFYTGNILEFLNGVRYPPFTKRKQRLARFFQIPYRRSSVVTKLLLCAILIGVLALVIKVLGISPWLFLSA